MIHLDATFAVDFIRERSARRRGPASTILESILLKEKLVVSVFVACELLAGALSSQRPEEERRKVRQFCSDFRVAYPDGRFSDVYGWIHNQLRQSGQMIGTMDVLIGTLAIVERASLVTRNVKHFKRIPNLEIISY